MGAWGSGSFENDTALDYLDDFVDAPESMGTDDEPGKVAIILGALAIAEQASTDIDDMPEGEDDDDTYLDSDIACCAIAAAELLAAIGGKPCEEFVSIQDTDDSRNAAWKWAQGKGRKEALLQAKDVRELAVEVATRIRDAGELHDLWHEAEPDDAKKWTAAMNDLITRLG